MTANNQIQKNLLNETFRRLLADIRAISAGDCEWAAADIDRNIQQRRVQIRYSVKPLLPENHILKELDDGGNKR